MKNRNGFHTHDARSAATADLAFKPLYKHRTPATLATLITVLAALPAHADFPTLHLQPINEPAMGVINAPVGLVNAADGSDRLFVVDQRGKIEIIQDGSVLGTPLIDLEPKLVPERPGFDERGLLGLAFHPNFGVPETPNNDKFYVYYSAPSLDPGTEENPIDHQSVIAEYAVTELGSNIADPLSERILLTFNQPQFNHDAGQIAFGPDGMLYIASGDGGSSDDNNAGHTGGNPDKPDGVLGNAQDRTNLLGKILRIDPAGTDGPGGEYGIPEDNPFATVGEGVRPEIYAYGMRNPWRFSFDDGPGGTGRLFVADVGQREVEEINIVESGGNYGWRVKEGDQDFDPTVTIDPVVPLINPIAQYTHPGTGFGVEVGLSVTGGFVYRGTEFPELQGKYIFADWSNSFGTPNGTLLGLEEDEEGNWSLAVLDVFGGNPIGRYITAFGEDEAGELYLVTKTTLAPNGDALPEEATGVIFKVAVPEPGTLGIAGVLGALASTARHRRRKPEA